MESGNEIEIWVNQKCLDNLKSLDSLKDEDLYLRAVSFLHFLGSESKRLPRGWKFCSIALLRKFHYKFDSLILPELIEKGFCHPLPRRKDYCPSEFMLEFDYEPGEPHMLALPEDKAARWRKAINILEEKKHTSGYWINTRRRFNIDFSRSQEKA